MKKSVVVFPLIFLVILFSCKKTIQKQEENAALNIMTDGTWKVSQYLQDSVDITSTLSQYNFQFYANGTVTGTNGSVSATGTWTTNIANHSITSAFPTGSGAVNELDAVWIITDSSPDYVIAYTTIDSVTDNLKLEKNPTP